MTNVYSDTPYSVKKPKCQGENLMGCNLTGRKDEMSIVPRVPENALFFFCAILVFLLFIYSPQLHSSMFLLLILPRKLCYSQMKGIFFTLCLSRNELVNIVSYLLFQ